MSVLSPLHELDTAPAPSRRARSNPRNHRHLALISALTVFAFLVHGYHPYAEDGGLYVSGIKRLLHPALYPTYTPFVTEHLRFSLFAPLVAALVRLTHLPLPAVLLTLYLASIWLTLLAAWRLAALCTPSFAGRAGAVTLFACWLTLPIAGTALFLADPYLTARSLSTPLTLLALSFALERRPLAVGLTLLFAATLHPLMAAYALAAILIAFLLFPLPSSLFPAFSLRILLLGTVVLLTALTLQFLAPPEPTAYLPIALSRSYWFPFWWHWYEQLGLVAPLAVLYLLRRRSPVLARTAITLGAIALVIAALFCRVHLATHLVARLQPLRSFQLVYAVMILLLGIWLGERVLRAHSLRWIAALITLGGIMFAVQRQTYPASPHLELPNLELPNQELPGIRTGNPWVQAFLWARDHTPTTAVFALDAHYITAPGEDAQHFRALAERSALPDYSKDGGEASITPALTEAWTTATRATLDLDAQSDATRLATLKPLGATWLILAASSPTTFPCPYANPTLKLCRLP